MSGFNILPQHSKDESQSVSHSAVSNSFQSMDYSPPSFSVREILQARMLELVPTAFPGDFPDPGTESVSLAL